MDGAGAGGRRRSSASSSPEFRFWPVDADLAASPSCADELFSGGVLLPLPVLLPRRACGDCYSHVAGVSECLGAAAAAAVVGGDDRSAAVTTSRVTPAAACASGGGGSKRWTDIFAKKPAEEKEPKRKDGAGCRRPAAAAGGGAGGSELNINIWPFSRSRSAGGGGSSSKPRQPPRKASSAPCSRSNSRGEAASTQPPPPRRWAASPSRATGGVPVGRSSPVWQIKRPSAAKHASSPDQLPDKRSRQKEKPTGGKKPSIGGGGGAMRSINLSVNSCIGYRHQVSCRRADAGVARSPGVAGGGLFGIKGFFSKKQEGALSH